MTAFVFDTSVLVDHLRGSEFATQLLFDAAAREPVLCSIMTLVELGTGMLEHQRPGVESLARVLDVVNVTRDIGDDAAGTRAGVVAVARSYGPVPAYAQNEAFPDVRRSREAVLKRQGRAVGDVPAVLILFNDDGEGVLGGAHDLIVGDERLVRSAENLHLLRAG